MYNPYFPNRGVNHKSALLTVPELQRFYVVQYVQIRGFSPGKGKKTSQLPPISPAPERADSALSCPHRRVPEQHRVAAEVFGNRDTAVAVKGFERTQLSPFPCPCAPPARCRNCFTQTWKACVLCDIPMACSPSQREILSQSSLEN